MVGLLLTNSRQLVAYQHIDDAVASGQRMHEYFSRMIRNHFTDHGGVSSVGVAAQQLHCAVRLGAVDHQEGFALDQNRRSVIPDGAGDDDPIARPDQRRGQLKTCRDEADSGGVEEQLVRTPLAPSKVWNQECQALIFALIQKFYTF